MPLDPKKVDEFLSLTRQESAAAVRPKSRLEPHREAILAAVAEGLPITAIRKVLEVHCDVKVTYTSLREWIKRQPDSSKGKGAIKKPAKTKEQLAAWARLKAHNPDDPLTLE